MCPGIPVTCRATICWHTMFYVCKRFLCSFEHTSSYPFQQVFEMGKKPDQFHHGQSCFLMELSGDQLIRCIPQRAGIGKFLIFRRRDFLQSCSRMAGSCRAGWHVTKVKGAVEASSGTGGFYFSKVDCPDFYLKAKVCEEKVRRTEVVSLGLCCISATRRQT